ncbi:MAG: hypothetical protein R3C13_12705, partial [Hyphomonas sp.]|uniref:hypothetical protein n=1 Tax=Hyphomonas sp. TaxID=87 RepID=UPI003528CA18
HLDGTVCSHHPLTELGDPLCDVRQFKPKDENVKDAVQATAGNTAKPTPFWSYVLSVWKWISGK